MDKVNVANLASLQTLSEDIILEVLKVRYENDLIYTQNGITLLAINPYKQLPIYDNRILQMYYNRGVMESLLHFCSDSETPLPPHVYKVADTAYRNMMNSILKTTDACELNSHQISDVKCQSILVSGESGSGKTETAKYMIKYLVVVGSTISSKCINTTPLSSQIEATTLVMEVFGNATTLRNYNSSRFGKFIKLQFNRKGYLIGATIDTYLLEKIRLVSHSHGEKNYHIFYQLVNELTNSQREEYKIYKNTKYHYLGKETSVESASNVDFRDGEMGLSNTISCMKVLQFSEEDISNMLRILSALIHLGNVDFISTDTGYLNSEDLNLCTTSIFHAKQASALLGMEFPEVLFLLQKHQIEIMDEIVLKSRTYRQAIIIRDGLTQAIYSALFNWIVARMNSMISSSSDTSEAFIGILDIFGFEIFEKNSLEQLCINYANEKLQQLFNFHVFQNEQKIYIEEKIEWSYVDYPTNNGCLHLIESRKCGILALLNDEVRLPKGSNKSLVRKFYKFYDDNEYFFASSHDKAASRFNIKHYAGTVQYNVSSFCEKNIDSLPSKVNQFLRQRSKGFLNSILLRDAMACSKTSIISDVCEPQQRKSYSSLCNKFQDQLKQLIRCIQDSCPHFLRCLKPNDINQSNSFSDSRVLEQLRYCGILEAVKVARRGFPVRMQFSEFFTRYCILFLKKYWNILRIDCDQGHARELFDDIRSKIKKEGDGKQLALEFGTTKVFLQSHSSDFLESQRSFTLNSCVTTIKNIWMVYQARRTFFLTKTSAKCIQRAFRLYLAKKELILCKSAAVKIQSLIRRKIQHKHYTTVLKCVKKIQRFHHRVVKDHTNKKISNEIKLIFLQSCVKRYIYRRRFLSLQQNVIFIQYAFRKILRKKVDSARTMSGWVVSNKREFETINPELSPTVYSDTESESNSSDNEPVNIQLLIIDLNKKLRNALKEVSMKDGIIENLQLENRKYQDQLNSIQTVPNAPHMNEIFVAASKYTPPLFKSDTKYNRISTQENNSSCSFYDRGKNNPSITSAAKYNILSPEENDSSSSFYDRGFSNPRKHLASFEAQLHDMKVQLLAGFNIRRVFCKEVEILKLSIDYKNKDQLSLLILNKDYTKILEFPVENIEDISIDYSKAHTNNQPNNNQEESDNSEFSSSNMLSILTSELDLRFYTRTPTERSQIANGLRNVLADSSLRKHANLPSTKCRRVGRRTSKTTEPVKKKYSHSIVRKLSAKKSSIRSSLQLLKGVDESDKLKQENSNLTEQLKEYKKSYEDLLVKTLEDANELCLRSTQVVELRHENQKLLRTIEEMDEFSEKECNLKLAMGKKVQDLLVEKEDLRIENQSLQRTIDRMVVNLEEITTSTF